MTSRATCPLCQQGVPGRHPDPGGTHAYVHPDADWIERDNFDTRERAANYRRFLHARFPKTPYRIVERDGRFVVEFVPAWRLQP